MDTVKAQGHVWEWKQDGALRQKYHLYEGEKVLATLQVGGLSGMNAQLEAGGRTLAIKRGGFFGTHYQINDTATSAEVANFEASGWGGGVLTFAGGQQAAWHKTSFWHNRYVFESQDGTELLRFEGGGLMKLGAKVEPVAALPNEEAMLLAGLGMYLLVAATNDSATVGAVVAATSA